MRLKHVKITNMATFASFDADLPVIAIIQGKNGVGKTSLAECIEYAFGRGHDPDIIHGNAEAGEVVVTFENGGQVKARASRKTNETERGWKAPGASRFTLNRQEIDRMAVAISYSPLKFLELSEKEQIETLLRVMPIKVTPEEIETAVGEAAAEAASISLPQGKSGLEVIDAIHGGLYGQRTDLNRDAKRLEAHAEQLKSTMAEEPPEGSDWVGVAAQKRAALQNLEKQEAITLTRLAEEFGKQKDAAEKACRAVHAAIDQDIDAKIKALEVERQTRKKADDAKRDDEISAARSARETAAENIRLKCAESRKVLTSELATAEERARAYERAKGTKAAISQAESEAAGLRSRSDVLTAALSRLDALKTAVAAKLPIKGISIAEGRIVDSKGVPLPRWNTETQYRFCLRLAVLGHGEAGFICLDGFEHFDSEHRKMVLSACQKYAEKDGLQFLLVAVSDGPLQIREPKLDSPCHFCREGIAVVGDEHHTAAGPVPCLEKKS